MFGKIEEYCSGMVYSPQTRRIECMKPQVSKEMQKVYEELKKKWNLAHGVPTEKGE